MVIWPFTRTVRKEHKVSYLALGENAIQIQGGSRPGGRRDLAESDLIIETHEMYRPGCTAQLLSVFSATHVHEVISPVARRWEDFPVTQTIPRLFRRYAVDEWRNPAQRWLWLRSRSAVRKPDGALQK